MMTQQCDYRGRIGSRYTRSPMLDDRKANILKAVVEEYIETAQPVGSGHVSRKPSVNVSPATVRNELVALEHEGYLVQPHTSAGRIPTDKGYRFFVDSLSDPGQLAGADAQQVRTFFARAHGELEQMLRDTSQLLAEVTDYAAVVVGPPHEQSTIRAVQMVGLAPRLALLVVVLSNGVIEKHTLELDEETDDAALAAATSRLSGGLIGTSVARVHLVTFAGPATKDVLVQAALDVLKTAQKGTGADHVYIGGASSLAASFDAVAQVSEVLRILEQQFVVVTLLRDVLDRGLNVAIGTETGIEPLADCALVVASFQAEGETVGTIGVLGPTRMNYPQALAAVAVVSQRLGDRLNEG